MDLVETVAQTLMIFILAVNVWNNYGVDVICKHARRNDSDWQRDVI